MIDATSISALGDEFEQIIKHATLTRTAAALTKLTKSIRPTPLPRVNLPAPKVG